MSTAMSGRDPMASNRFDQPFLEDWFRRYYYTTQFDIGSSGVDSFTLGDIRRLTGITHAQLDELVFTDGRTFGDDRTRQAIANRWGNGDLSTVMVTHGSSEAIFLTMNALLQAGDEVVVLNPVYHQLAAVPKVLGCRIKHWDLRVEEKYAPDLDRLRSLLTDSTRMIILNFPHNPTGTTVSEPEMLEILHLADRVGCYVFWDNAFSDLTYGKPPLTSPHLLYERSVVVGTLSKAYGLPGLRFGWCMAQPDVLDACIALRDNVTLHLSPLNELIASRAIENGDRLLEDRLGTATRNLSLLARWAESNSDRVDWIAPRGGVCTSVGIRGESNTEALCARLANDCGVLLVPGLCFGEPNRVRLGFGGSPANLAEGLSRLSEQLALA